MPKKQTFTSELEQMKVGEDVYKRIRANEGRGSQRIPGSKMHLRTFDGEHVEFPFQPEVHHRDRQEAPHRHREKNSVTY